MTGVVKIAKFVFNACPLNALLSAARGVLRNAGVWPTSSGSIGDRDVDAQNWMIC